MGLNPKLLGAGEVEVRHMRTHVKAIFLPILLFLLLAGLLGVGLALMPSRWDPWGRLAVGVVFLVLLVWWVVAPIIRWTTNTYTLTNRRIITRRGILNKAGHDLPLSRINDVSYQRSLLDRMFGCGTLVLTTAAEDPVALPDIPDIERVHVQMTDLLFGSHQVEPRGDGE